MKEQTPEEVKPDKELPTVETLKAQREKLEKQVAQITIKRASDLAKHLNDREILVKEATKLDSLIVEARKNLEFYKKQISSGVLEKEAFTGELGELDKLVVSLEEQRKAVLDKSAALMDIPDVNEKVYEQAKAEDGIKNEGKKVLDLRRELQEIEANVKAHIDEEVPKLADVIEDWKKRREDANTDWNKKNDTYNAAINEVRGVVNLATRKLPDHPAMRTLLENLFREGENANYPEFFLAVKKQRATLGFFDGKAKAVLDAIIKEEGKFTTAQQAQKDLKEARSKAQSFSIENDKTIDPDLVAKFKPIFLEARTAEEQRSAILAQLPKTIVSSYYAPSLTDLARERLLGYMSKNVKSNREYEYRFNAVIMSKIEAQVLQAIQS